MSFICVGSEFTAFFSKGLAKASPVLLELLSCKALKANISVKVCLCHIYYLVAKVIALVFCVALAFYVGLIERRLQAILKIYFMKSILKF